MRQSAAIRFFLCATGLMAASSASAGIDPEAEVLIGRARAAIASEESLEAVRALAFAGKEISVVDGSELTYSAVLKRPLYQRLEQSDGEFLIVTAVDEFEGWMLRRALASPLASSVINPMDTTLYRRMRGNTITNLYFFRGYKVFGGEVVVREPGEFEGRAAHVLEFREDPRSPVVRYFDKETFRLLATEIGDGITLVERGEQHVGGIRFPKQIESYRNGQLVGRLTVETIQVNPPVDLGIFAYPRLP